MTNDFQCDVDGRTLRIETGRLAEQANGAVTVHYGETVVLVTACTSAEPREGLDFLPLTIDYEERLYAAGKIPGSFFRREGRPSQEAVLTSRLTDRPLRPLFPKDFRHDIQVVMTVLSADQENDPDILAIIGASAALGISDIPFGGPVAASRVGYIDGEYVLDPTFTQLTQSKLDLVIAGTRDGAVMVEAEAKELTEDIVLQGIKFGQEANQEVINLQERLIQAFGRPKTEFKAKELSSELQTDVAAAIRDKLGQGLGWKDRAEREEVLNQLEGEIAAKWGSTYSAQEISLALELGLKERMRALILEEGTRPDGRGLTDIRPISCEVGAFPRTHGSGLFTRGQTQVLTIATLGSPGQEQQIDGIGQEESKRFMHHYNFPPFSTGEVKRMGSPGRREIGHGALAERALAPVLPDEVDFPYTIRLVSEVLSSNGSTSMASVCGSTLSLMDAGVPIKTPVAGVAMGLITGENNKFAVLTDIEGLEDALGDMDFKVAGTAEGITALQMDIKIKSVSYEIMEQCLSQARDARLFILDRMKETISASRPEISKYAPRLTKITIDPEKIRHVIGPGGRTIRSIMSETKVTIDVDNDGTVLIGSPSEEATQKAISIIEELTRDVEVGGTYTGRVTRVTNFGAFVEILPGKEGLVHISELADYRAPSVADVVKVGDEVMVMVTEIDRMGRINLSRRAVLEKLSQIPGARLGTDQQETPNYPFRRQTEPRHPRPYRDEDRGYGDRRAPRERPGSTHPKGPPH
ncbi:MAG: polyribonucleotide nucleotidyltransferase [Dehalococcoidia bacterium]|nr:MAG: polyribonucleotide nucleotidyltransferase [Dehalococcoidia bacterium]